MIMQKKKKFLPSCLSAKGSIKRGESAPAWPSREVLKRGDQPKKSDVYTQVIIYPQK